MYGYPQEPESQPVDWGKVAQASVLALSGAGSLASAGVLVPETWAKALLVIGGVGALLLAFQMIATSGLVRIDTQPELGF